MSAPYLSQLRSWHRSHPSQATIEALAVFFRVDPRYFTDDECFNDLDKELDFRPTCAIRRFSALRRASSASRPRLNTMSRGRAEQLRLRNTSTRADTAHRWAR
jgi:hypothetical protein